MELLALVNRALESSLDNTAAVGVAVGVAVHLFIRPFEIDNRAWTLIILYNCSLAGLLAGYVNICHFEVVDALWRTIVVGSSFIAGLAGSILLYRAFFHRLRRFPGPFAARLSRLHAMSLAKKNMQSMIEVQKLHAQYGDIVRTGPRELSINRPSAISKIYGPPTTCGRGPIYAQSSDEVNKYALNFCRDLDMHKRRKKPWERGLSFRALAEYMPRVAQKVDLLMSQLRSRENKPIDMALWVDFFSFDVMGDIGFSKDFGMLEAGKEHPAMKGLHGSMAAMAWIGTMPWIIMMLDRFPFLLQLGGIGHFVNWCANELKEKRKVLKKEKSISGDKTPQDVLAWLLKDEGDLGELAPPIHRMTEQDARTLVLGGSDTTSSALTNAIYYLTKTPACYQKLQELLRREFLGGERDWSYEKVKGITYLDHIIQETMRLKPPVVTGMTRMTPSAGLQIDDDFIPGDVVVSVPTYTIHRDPRHWKDPLDFIPERWEAVSPEKTPWIPFTRGDYGCPGKHLAMMEMRMVLSRIALRYDLAFAKEETADEFDKGAKDTFTLNVPSLPLILTPV